MKVAAVIVCFNPDLELLGQTCDQLLLEGAHVILVDNSEISPLPGSPRLGGCTIIANNGNLGIARAQNIGIREAVRNEADAVVFFDQDSVIGEGFLRALTAPLKPGVVGVVAPVSLDAVHGFEYAPTTVSRIGLQTKVFSDGRTEPYPVHIVLASGVAATVQTFAQAGEMDEDLFIDYVDLEWCLRCKRKNIPLLVVPAAVMKHSIGSRSMDAGVATVLVHSPVRCYYQVRNSLLLFRRKSVPKLLAARETLVLLVHKALLLPAVPNRSAYASAFFQGFRDGLRGVTGKQPEK